MSSQPVEPPVDSVDPPSDWNTPIGLRGKLLEAMTADVNVSIGTSHALVLDCGCGGFSLVLDGDGLATKRVAIGLSSHEEMGQSNNYKRSIL